MSTAISFAFILVLMQVNDVFTKKNILMYKY